MLSPGRLSLAHSLKSMDKFPNGIVASLHVHPVESGEPLLAIESVNLVEGKGILEDTRFLGRRRRQVTLIEREQLARHADALGVGEIAPGAARANIETTGMDLERFIGHRLRIGETILHINAPRTPCHKMDRICQGLRELMENGKQGVLATVVKGGSIRVGDSIGAESPMTNSQ
jgi:MOSC domain-containing protein YiiM